VYDAAARARRMIEPVKRADAGVATITRSEFERDRARVLHSYAFRRLADKTQVVVPGEDDFPRTRLTHSLEVAQIAREMGAALGCDPDVVDAAGLAHDLGHPPFGHNGEDALDELARSIGGFEANAQTLRILTRLEAKVIGPDGSSAGLNLTRATLDAATKYPWLRREGSRKFGVYAEDRGAFDWIRVGAPDDRQCLEAQVMDWADDVAYSVHDVEDGVYGGHICLAEVDDQARDQLVEVARELYTNLPASMLELVLERLFALPTLADLAGYDGSFAAQAAAKRATSELTGRFVAAAVRATWERFGARPLSRYAADLVIPDAIAAECALLKALAAHYVMRRPGTDERLAGQRRTLHELASALYESAPDRLGPVARAAWTAAVDDAGRLRAVVDQVAQLTDPAAVSWHAALCGRSDVSAHA
jgi:dGTPase